MVHFCWMRWLTVSVFWLLVIVVNAQESLIRVKGRVLEERGQPVPN
ncbi:MAG: hypothetical protein RLZZ205_477, partial [Bacteroidota bacterium]